MEFGGSSFSAAPRRLVAAGDAQRVAAKMPPMQAYGAAMELMWNYELEAARQLLEPWRSAEPWHAGAYAECAALHVVLTGCRSEAAAALNLVHAAEALARNCSKPGVALQVLQAELMLLRSGLQAILGERFRAALSLRQCWGIYRCLEECLTTSGPVTGGGPLAAEDLRGRVTFGLGLFHLAGSLLPAGLRPLARLAGFATHNHRGTAYLSECAERSLGPRATPAALLLAAYHLNIEPDVRRAGELLVASLGRQPENVLLHWAGSILAWRNTCISQAVQMTSKALWCCGEELGNQAVYLRYELGMFYFLAMDWPGAWQHLVAFHDAVCAGAIFCPYKTVVVTQLAAAAFSMGLDAQGEALCCKCAALQDTFGTPRLEADFAEVLQGYLKKRIAGRQLLAFEVMYLLRQLSKMPEPMLLAIQARLKDEALQRETAGAAEAAVERTGVLVLQCIVLFHLGDVEQAMVFLPELVQLCTHLPQWCTYLSAHGLYWCGRMFSLSERQADALVCFRQAKAHRRYPFNISGKINKVMQELEAGCK